MAEVKSKSVGDGKDLLDLVSRCEHRVAVSTILAWFVFVLSAMPVAHWVLADSSASDQAFFVVWTGVLALGPAFVNLPQRVARRALVFGLIACALAAVLVVSLAAAETADAVPPSDTDVPDILETAMGAVAVGLVCVSVFHRRLRGLVLPTFVVAAVALILLLIPIGYVEPHLGACIAEGSASGSLALAAPFFLTAYALAVWLGLKALDGLARLVEGEAG